MDGRKLKIKQGACNRLMKDFQGYMKEKKDLDVKTEKLRAQGADAHALKKHREFVDETDTTLQDTRIRAVEAFEELSAAVEAYKREGKIDAAILEATEATLALAASLFQPAGEQKDAPAKAVAKKRVVVFGSSTAVPSSGEWSLAADVGRKLATAGAHLVTGGYGGLMEASSSGAKEIEGATIEGITCPSAFPGRVSQNKYLTQHNPAPDLQTRLRMLSEADAFIVLPGSLGTLTELVYVWNLAWVNQLAGKGHAPIFALSYPWQDAIEGVGKSVMLPDQATGCLTFVDNKDLAWLDRFLS